MTDSQQPAGRLYRILRNLRYALPAAAVALVGVEQAVALTLFRAQPGLQLLPWEALLYATLGPLVLWFGLSWFAGWVRGSGMRPRHSCAT